jgi:formylglycine-generating enzyme required for sulfatase activity
MSFIHHLLSKKVKSGVSVPQQSIIAFMFRIVHPSKSTVMNTVIILIVAILLMNCGYEPGSTETELVTETITPQTPTLTVTVVPTETNSSTPSKTITRTPSNTPVPTATSSITPYPTQMIDSRGTVMVLVPAGVFLMGSDSWSGSEKPAHEVYLDSYYIDQFEVSNNAFCEFLNEVGNQIEGIAGKAHWVEENDPDLQIRRIDGVWQTDPGRENHPMNEVTWFGARAFCEWRNARLPSEAEWEKAARGIDGRTYPWGETEPTCEMANFAGCYYDSVPVDSFPEWVSPYGAYNMAGNVHEWTNDWYSAEYYANAPIVNPTGPENGDYKVFRGASWFNGNFQTRTTYRYPKLPVLTYMANGFRCASSVID